jgi:hypothetical protein
MGKDRSGNVSAYQEKRRLFRRLQCRLWLFALVLLGFCLTTSGAKAQEVLPAPKSLKAAAVNSYRMDLTWQNTTTTETGFKVWRRSDISTPWSELGTTGAGVTYYSDTTVAAGMTYYYAVTANNLGSQSAFSNTAKATTPIYIAAPDELGATPAAYNQIDLTWRDNSTNEQGFSIEGKAAGAIAWKQVGKVKTNVTAYSILKLSPLTTYSYRVRAYAGKKAYSAYSDEAEATTLDYLAPPKSLKATVLSADEVSLSWQDTTATESGFKVWRTAGSSGLWSEVGAAGANVTSYSDTTVTSSTSYSYKVQGYNDEAISAFSNIVKITTPIHVAAADELTATPAAYNKINLGWHDNSNNESGFKIECKIGAATTWNQIASVAANSTSYSHLNLTATTNYTYRVRAYTGKVYSSYSDEAEAATPSPLNAPGNLSADPVAWNQIDLSWQDNSNNETGYKIECKAGSSTTWVQIDTVGENVTTYSHIGLETSTPYSYRICAYYDYGNSAYSNTAGATTPIYFPAPSDLEAVAGESKIDLTWQDNSPNEAGFKIERKIEADGDWEQLATVAADVTSYEDFDIAGSTNYYYRVRAYTATVNSACTDEASATTGEIWESEAVNWEVDYGENWNKTGWVTKPGANHIRLHFSAIHLVAGEDTLTSNAGDSWSDAYVNITSEGKLSDSISLALASDATGYFIIDRVEWQGPATGPATVSGGLFNELASWQSETVNWRVDYENNWNWKPGWVCKPGASKIRIHFSSINMGDSADYLDVGGYFDYRTWEGGAGDEWQGGPFSDVTSSPQLNNTVILEVNSNSTNTGHFIIDRVDWQGDATGAASHGGDLFGIPDVWQSETVNWRVDYGNDWQRWGRVTKPEAALIRLHFSAISLHPDDGLLVDNWDEGWDTWDDGYYENVTTGAQCGNAVNLALVSDASDTGYFIIDRVEWVGASATAATKGGELFGTPLAPGYLTATAVSTSQINLSWQDNADNETGFRIWRKTSLNDTWTLLNTVAANTVSYHNIGLTAGVRYTYRVCAYNATGTSYWSDEAGDTPLNETAQQRIQRLVDADYQYWDIVNQYAWFNTYYQAHTSDLTGRFGYAITRFGAAAQQLAAKYGINVNQLTDGTDFQSTLALATSGKLTDVEGTVLKFITGKGNLLLTQNPSAAALATSASGTTISPTDLADDIRTILIPALQDAISVLTPVVASNGVITTVDSASLGTVNIRAEEALTYRAALELTSFALSTSVAYSYDDGSFDWNRTPQQMDANHNGYLTASEYLPGGSFLTLTSHGTTDLSSAWSNLNAALNDIGDVADKMLDSPDPDQLLSQSNVDWADVLTGVLQAQDYMSGPQTISVDYYDWDTGDPATADITVNCQVFWVSPISNLRNLAPIYEIYEDGYGDTYLFVSAMPAPTMGGIFPNGSITIPLEVWNQWFLGDDYYY